MAFLFAGIKFTGNPMSVQAAYLSIILIWSTTPLAIQWSTDGVGFLFALLARMTIGVIVCLLLLKIFRIPLPMHKQARRVYLAGGLGIYGAMLCVYWASRYIPSGLIAVLFGLSFHLRERWLIDVKHCCSKCEIGILSATLIAI